MTTTHESPIAVTLEHARQAIHQAVAAHDDPHRRRQYAATARDYAAAVLVDPAANIRQRDCAGSYLDDATAFLSAGTCATLIDVNQASEWAGRPLDADDLDRLTTAIPHSSIPDAIATIVDSWDD